MNTQQRNDYNHIDILIAEDSPTQADQLKYMLEQHNYHVFVATNGNKALALMDHRKPTLVISDIVMPEMDGYELCRAIKADKKFQDIPVILLTSLSGPGDVINGLKCGADNFIRKPLDERLLIGRIQYILANREVRRSEKMHIGVELLIGGEKHYITAERQQILDLLISTYDEAVHLNEDLKRREKQLDRANKILKGIYRIAKGLNSATTEHEVVELVLARALELPDVRAGWISLREGESEFRLAGSRGLPPALKIPGAMEGDCLCHRRALSGEIDRSTNITECERLQRSKGDTQGLRSHVTVPLRCGNTLLGILNLVGSNHVLFDDDDLAVLNGIGNQIAAALDRCRMHQHLEYLVQERTAELTAEIAERKQAEKRIIMLAHALRSINECVSITDMDDNVLFVNEAFLKTYGYDEHELIGRHVGIVRSPNNHPEVVREILPATLRGGWHGELLNRRKAGSDFPIFLSTSVLRDDEGKKMALIGVATDITERKRIESERTRLIRILEATPDLVALGDPQGNVIYHNRAGWKMLGIDHPETISRWHARDSYPDWAAKIVMEEGIPAAIQEGTWRGETALRTRDGREIPVSQVIISHKNEDGTLEYLSTIIRDLSERKQAEQTRKNLEAQLLQAQKLESLGTLAGGIAHDFNNILGIILGHSTLLERAKLDPETRSQSIEAITKATHRGTGLVKQLLTFARKTGASLEPVRLNDTIAELSKLLQQTFPKTITISTSLQQDLPAIVADASQIHQVLLNLCVNARDAMPERGTLSISTRAVEGGPLSLRFGKATARQYAQIEVADTGLGMDEATRQRIFEPFFTTKGPGKGTGLGLAVVFGIVEHHNGFIDVRSAHGEGTCFTVYLPIPERAPEMSQRSRKSIDEIGGGTETILVIEDEETLRELLKATLAAKGYTVLVAGDGEEALQVFSEHKNHIKLVLSDMGLPKLDGAAVFSILKKNNPELPVIMASGYIEPKAKESLLENGVKAFIQKPYEADEILKRIREVIDGKVRNL